jgi:hypothetical protein
MAFDTANTAVTKILKEVYEGPVREQLNTRTYFLSKVKKNRKNFEGGKYAVIPLHIGRNVGVGSRQEDAGLDGVYNQIPGAGNQQYDNAIYKVKYHYGQIKVTGPARSATKSNVGSFVRGIKSEMDGLQKDVAQDQNRQFWHDGTSVLTRCKTTTASANLEVESTKYLQAGMVVDICNGSDGANITNGSAVTISSITDADTAVLPAVITTDTNDVVIRTGTRNRTSSTTWKSAVESWGLEALCNNANPGTTNGLDGASDSQSYVGGINRTGNLWWQTPMINMAGALTLDGMQQAFDQTDIETDTVPGLILTNHAIRRKYLGLVTADKRFVNELSLDGGFKALDYNGVPMVVEKDASLTQTPQTLGRIYFLSMSAFEFHINEDWQWYDDDGAVLCRTATNKDSAIATYFSYSQLGIDNSRKCAVLHTITE